ncbi:hypothetical protein [Halalkalibacter krulwichiae]|uniref:Uncharacterized protein n=1 Tax=Halalkalibacter krulwichiae TaxID=199441 RepID=A0A1X9MGT4_9BACI|nr:hypothetical protein [Halalkalibacter krulwichiae]ARK31720.1 hypothetical protein BkAM31D_18790 [Halalkalibacter krulwichiae]
MSVEYIFDSRLGLSIPKVEGTWSDLSIDIQQQVLAKWEAIRGTIPDRIKEIEKEIEIIHEQLTEEEDFERSCELNLEMAELASTINELWIWFRVSPTVT